MNLRSPLNFQQLLSVAIGLLLMLVGTVRGQDSIVTADGKQQTGKIVGATPSGVQIETAPGSVITYPKAQIKEVRMAVIPPEFALAQKSLEAKNYDVALTQLKVLEKFKGLPADWAQQATAMIGDIYIEKGDVSKAEAAFGDFQKLYPGGAQAELGLAKLAVAKKDFAKAKVKLEPVIAKAEADKNVTRSTGFTYSQAYYLMGQVKESEGDHSGALQDYLKTVTLYYYDRASVTQAQLKADALRKANPEIFVP